MKNTLFSPFYTERNGKAKSYKKKIILFAIP